MSVVCPTWIKVTRQCGSETYVRVPCPDHFCKTCAAIRSENNAAKWAGPLSKLTTPKFITLTIESGDDLDSTLQELQASFRRLMHLSLGERNFKELCLEAYDWLYGQAEKYGFTRGTLRLRENRLRGTINRIHNVVSSVYTRDVFRFRDLIAGGIRTIEVTKSKNGWHPHIHMVVECDFISSDFLKVLWLKATKGKGQIVDIRRADKRVMPEIFKYIVKHSTIETQADRDEVRQVLFGKKKLWAIGFIEPDIVKPEFCRHCEGKLGEDCVHTSVDFGYTRWRIDPQNEQEYGLMYEVKFACSDEREIVAREAGGWVVLSLIPPGVCAPTTDPQTEVSDDMEEIRSRQLTLLQPNCDKGEYY